MRRKAQGKNKYAKGVVTLQSTKKDLAWDWILVKGLHKYSDTSFKLDMDALWRYYDKQVTYDIGFTETSSGSKC